LIGNHALDNYRKGLDFHSGMNGVVSDNIVLRNRCDGIYVMGVSGSWTITGNVIADMLWTGEFDIPMYAMRFGELRGQGKHDIPTSFNVTGNTISNFRMTGGVAVFPILLGGQGLSYGKFNISNNILQLGRVTKILECQPRVKRAAGNYFDVSFDSNQIYCSEVVEVPFTIRGTFNRKKSFSNNQIEIAVAHGTADIFSYDNTSVAIISLVANSNDFTVPTGSFASDIIHIKRTGKEVMLGNIVNGSPWRDWDGIKFIAAGSSAKPPSDMRMWTVGSAWQTTKVGAGGSPGAICTKAGLVAPAWTGKTAYSKVGQLVANDTGKIYKLIKAGRSASSGGPKGRAASGIADGSCVWGYVGVLAVFKVLPAIAA
jgi:parallel beta-helix repeat protein